MRVIFSGAEVGSNRNLLFGSKVESMGLNFWTLRKRGLPTTKRWLISEHFDADTQVFIESGAAQADKAGLSKEELTSLAADYQEFLVDNSERASAFMEFDSIVLGNGMTDKLCLACIDKLKTSTTIVINVFIIWLVFNNSN